MNFWRLLKACVKNNAKQQFFFENGRGLYVESSHTLTLVTETPGIDLRARACLAMYTRGYSVIQTELYKGASCIIQMTAYDMPQ